MISNYDADDVIDMAEGIDNHRDWNTTSFSTGHNMPKDNAEIWAESVEDNKQPQIELKHKHETDPQARVDFQFPNTRVSGHPFYAELSMTYSPNLDKMIDSGDREDPIVKVMNERIIKARGVLYDMRPGKGYHNVEKYITTQKEAYDNKDQISTQIIAQLETDDPLSQTDMENVLSAFSEMAQRVE